MPDLPVTRGARAEILKECSEIMEGTLSQIVYFLVEWCMRIK